MTITSAMAPFQIARALSRFCEERDIAPSRFGRQAVNDPRLIFDLRAGRRPRPETVEQINAALASEALA